MRFRRQAPKAVHSGESAQQPLGVADVRAPLHFRSSARVASGSAWPVFSNVPHLAGRSRHLK